MDKFYTSVRIIKGLHGACLSVREETIMAATMTMMARRRAGERRGPQSLIRALGFRQARGSAFPELGYYQFQPRVLIIKISNTLAKIEPQGQCVSSSKQQHRHTELQAPYHEPDVSRDVLTSHLSSHSLRTVGTSSRLPSPKTYPPVCFLFLSTCPRQKPGNRLFLLQPSTVS